MTFGLLDYGMVVAYLIFIIWLGLRFRKQQRSLNDFFLGGRTLPWYAIAFSIVATETSILTVVGMPGIAYDKNMLYFQIILGNLIGRIFAVFVFIPKYYAGSDITAYQFIGRCFGRRVQQGTSALFIGTRVLAEGVRIFAAAIAISLIIRSDVFTAILVLVGLTLIYTVAGGVSAVIWTDSIQFVLYMIGAGVSLYFIISGLPQGFTTLIESAGPKLQILDFSLDFLRPYTFWAGMFCGVFQTMASQGTDQLLVQRLLAARNEKQSKAAVLAAAGIFTVQYFVFLFLGVALYVFFQYSPPSDPLQLPDKVYPYFIVSHLPTGLAGLVIVGMIGAAMSTTSSSLNSIASASVVDFYPGANRLNGEEQLRLSRKFTILWAGIFVGVAMLARGWGNVAEAGLEVIAMTYGALLGIFLLGLWTPVRSEMAGFVGLGTGLATALYLKFFTPIPFTWYFSISTSLAFLASWLIGRVKSHWDNSRR